MLDIHKNRLYCAIKHFLSSNSMTKPLFLFIHKRRAVKKQLIKAHIFQKSVRQLFPKIIEIFNSLGIDYFICFGTLLGAIREHDFIKHDFDLEFGVFSDQYYPQLVCEFDGIGFKKQYRYYMADSPVKNEGFVEKYSNGEIHFDLFVFSRNTDYIWCWSYLRDETNVLNAIKLQWPNSGFERISFQGLEVPAPRNPQDFLEALYGKGWSKPCVYWEDSLANNIIEIDKIHGRFESVQQ